MPIFDRANMVSVEKMVCKSQMETLLLGNCENNENGIRFQPFREKYGTFRNVESFYCCNNKVTQSHKN